MALTVIGTGFPRTGTMSLKLALNQLGFGPCYHASETFMHPEHVPLWVRAGGGEAVWDTLFEGYHATTDAPACYFWRELTERYPTAKVLHSTRDPEDWFASTQATVYGPDAITSEPTPELKPLRDMLEKRRGGGSVNDRAFLIDWFTRHEAEVKAAIPAERLLVFEASQGWAPLCAFLGVPVPDTPYPRVNERAQTAAMIARMRAAGRDPKVVHEAMEALAKPSPPS
jgi:hypothetical protein